MAKVLGLLFLVAAFLAAVFGLFVGLGLGAQRIASDFDGSVALGGATIFATTALALWQFDRTKRKEADARLFSERAAVYQKLVTLLRDMIFEQKGWAAPITQDTRAQQLAEISYEMTVRGGQEKKRANMRNTEIGQSDSAALMKTMAQLYRAIRKDLGHSDDNSLPNDLVLQMNVPEDREKVRQQLK